MYDNPHHLCAKVIACDVKFSYLLKGYFNIDTDVVQGLQYLVNRKPKPQILLIYCQMLENGYVVHGGYSINLPSDWTENTRELDLVYFNSIIGIYVGGGI